MSLCRRLQPATGIATTVIAASIGYLLRNVFIEPEKFGSACEISNPWWCGIRTGFIVLTRANGLGLAATVLALTALVILIRGGAPFRTASMAMIVGGLGLALYNATFSIAAVCVATLLLARLAVKPS